MRVVLLASLLAVSWLTNACSSTPEKVTAPTATAPSDAIGSSPAPDRGRPPSPQPPPPTTGNCDSTNVQWAIGERASDALLERARVAAGAGTARYIRPNQPITTEYLGSRLNLNLNAQDVVQSVSCG